MIGAASVPPPRLLALPDGAVARIPPSPPDPAAPPPLIVLLHGAGQTPQDMLARFGDDADAAGAVLLAPKSAGVTWDVIAMAARKAFEASSLSDGPMRYSRSPDGDRVAAAMAALAARITTDPSRQWLVGFSDGASFALAMGTARDRRFTNVVALSPGLSVIAARPAPGRMVLVMHGMQDRSLPFDYTRSTIVPALRSARLAVTFVPFAGGHEIVAGALGSLKVR